MSFVILAVLIATCIGTAGIVGTVALTLMRRSMDARVRELEARSSGNRADGLGEQVELLEGRVGRMEEELDFYRKLLDDPAGRDRIRDERSTGS